MNNVIEFADGSKIEGKLGYTGHNLAVYGPSQVLIEHLPDFMSPQKTSDISFYYGTHKDIYHGFTRFSYLEHTSDDRMIVWLSGDDTSIETMIPTVPVEYLPKE